MKLKLYLHSVFNTGEPVDTPLADRKGSTTKSFLHLVIGRKFGRLDSERQTLKLEEGKKHSFNQKITMRLKYIIIRASKSLEK